LGFRTIYFLVYNVFKPYNVMARIAKLIEPVNDVLREDINKLTSQDYSYILERLIQIKNKLIEIKSRE